MYGRQARNGREVETWVAWIALPLYRKLKLNDNTSGARLRYLPEFIPTKSAKIFDGAVFRWAPSAKSYRGTALSERYPLDWRCNGVITNPTEKEGDEGMKKNPGPGKHPKHNEPRHERKGKQQQGGNKQDCKEQEKSTR